jgi:lysophospholipase
LAPEECRPGGPGGSLERRATGQCLPKSNQRRGHHINPSTHTATGITNPALAPINRRAIPAHAHESRWTLPDGHALRRIDWPGEGAAPRGSILFMPGRGDHYEKYLETLEQWHRAGWRVTAFDWRGQGDSGRLGKDPLTGHVEDFALWIDDLAAMWAAWSAEAAGPRVLIGHSMGGHLVMRAATEARVDPDAMVLSAPMLGMNGPELPLAILHTVAKLMTAIGDPTRPAWKSSEKPGEKVSARAQLLTHDPDRYEDEMWWRAARPEVLMGPASWRWVERAYASWRMFEAPDALERVAVPVLIVSTTADRLVSHPANIRAAQRLPKGELVEFGAEAYHEILREVDPVRERAMAAIAEFLDRVVPAQ